MREKRKYMRFDVQLNAVCPGGGSEKKIKIHNFSKEGAGLLCREPFNEGDDIEIELMIPGDNVPVLLEGEMVWASDPISDNSQYKGGVKFKKIYNGDKSRILEYIYRKWIKPADFEAKVSEGGGK
ncbi:MAG: PilZ domain-containing protein [Candidatus Omnitrophota bacterium]|nr:PilZ domain-containing protein [Candidatus Omnitrophota bacterium]